MHEHALSICVARAQVEEEGGHCIKAKCLGSEAVIRRELGRSCAGNGFYPIFRSEYLPYAQVRCPGPLLNCGGTGCAEAGSLLLQVALVVVQCTVLE